MLKGSLCLAALASLFMSGAAFAQEKIKVGVTATLEGTYTVLGEDGIRGFQTALNKFGKKVGDKELEFVIASTDATPDSAVRAVRKLIEQDKVQILLSPLSGDEGIAVKNFAKTHPELTFINAASGAQETTYVDPAPNFFRFNMDGAQWQVGLGKYAYETKGYRKIATVGEDYSFIYTQVFGLVLEFCGAGGQVTNRQWVPLGTKDFASVIAALPDCSNTYAHPMKAINAGSGNSHIRYGAQMPRRRTTASATICAIDWINTIPVVSALMMIYLFYALLRPEKF